MATQPSLHGCHQTILYLEQKKKKDTLPLMDTGCVTGVHTLLKVLDFGPVLGIEYRSLGSKTMSWEVKHFGRYRRKDK